MRSCESRDNLRTRRPKMTMGATTSGTPTSESAASFGLVTNIMVRLPTDISRLRSAKEAEEPTTVCTKVVSAVRRDRTSPVRTVSKKLGESDSTWEKTLERTWAAHHARAQR